MSEYEASGGTSHFFEIGDGEELRIEVHPEDYAVLWSTGLDDYEALSGLDDLFPDSSLQGVVHADGEDAHRLYDLSGERLRSFADRVHTDLESVDFLRIDYEDRVLTWERQDRARGRRNEIGFLAERFDASYLVALVAATATRDVIAIAQGAIYEAAGIVRRFPSLSLFPNRLYPDEPGLDA